MIGWILRSIRRILRRNRRKGSVRFAYKIGLVTQKQRQYMLELTITNEQEIPVTLTPVTATGTPAKLDGAPTWTTISGESTAVVADDGLSAALISSDNPGDTEFLVKADADLGTGVVEISDIIKLTVQGAQAQSLGLSAGTPVPKRTPPTPA